MISENKKVSHNQFLGGILEAGASSIAGGAEHNSLKEIFHENIQDDARTLALHESNLESAYKYFSKFDDEPGEKIHPIEYLLVIGFDHKIGSIVEFIYPQPKEGDLDDEV